MTRRKLIYHFIKDHPFVAVVLAVCSALFSYGVYWLAVKLLGAIAMILGI